MVINMNHLKVINMQQLYAKQSASISELKKNPSQLIKDAKGKPIAILNHNTAAAYLIPAETFEILLSLLDDIELETIIQQRLSDNTASIKVDLDDL